MLGRFFKRNAVASSSLPELPAPYNALTFGAYALHKLVEEFDFETMLDIGSGAGEHSAILKDRGKEVTAVDFGTSVYAETHEDGIDFVCGNYIECAFAKKFDAVWACHVLEHQPNANLFLKKMLSDVVDGGAIAITVPPLKHQIVGGHLSLWNAGLLLYNLVLAGNDCSDASILRYGYNISVIVRRADAKLPELTYDSGDVARISASLPQVLSEGVDGNFSEANWSDEVLAKDVL